MLRDRFDEFRVSSGFDFEDEQECGHCWLSTPSNELNERNVWDRHMQLLTASKPNQGENYAIKRLNQLLPFTPQTYVDTPLLDTALFRYDDRHVAFSDKPKVASEFPIRFFSRKSDRLAFRLDSSAMSEDNSASSTYRTK